MTVEMETTSSKLGGLSKAKTTTIADYRTIEETRGPITIFHVKPAFLILHTEPSLDPDSSPLPSLITCAMVKSEDSVEVYDSDLFSKTNARTYVEDEINQASLITDNGKVRLKWRKTLSGDYPEPPEGQVEIPRQLEFNLR